ncbi:hypothetical protein [Actinomycetospora chiangmaiensis]|uniref:hypothetical protein n=1 Tax=Actinomycetospora chiangmaiensis TaxID=402650 RepID=UPI00038235EF|nr:hypothetical protein [Actinomycetospora chiangmaiensis]
MSTFRKTVLTTAIIGAGLASTSGAAFATECPSHDSHEGHKSHSTTVNNTTNNTCVNSAKGKVDNGGAKQLGLINGSQGAIGANVICDVLNNSVNGNLSNNTVNIGGLGGLPTLP